MIQKNNGDITTSLGLINSKLTLDEYRTTELFNDISDFVDHQNGHANYTFRNIKIGNQDFSITLYFHGNKLFIVSLFCHIELLNNEISWSNWSLESEQKRKELHDKLLVKWLGKGKVNSNTLIYKYKWGIINSTYDPKSGSSNISINYK